MDEYTKTHPLPSQIPSQNKKARLSHFFESLAIAKSGWQDLNLRPHAPQSWYTFLHPTFIRLKITDLQVIMCILLIS